MFRLKLDARLTVLAADESAFSRAIVTAMVTANPSVAAIGRATAADILDHALRVRAH